MLRPPAPWVAATMMSLHPSIAVWLLALLPSRAESRRAFIRGVNLGSTFVPERWMVPSLFDGTDATSFCGLVRQNPTLAAERMQRHLDTFVTEVDFAWIAANGFNAVRVPLGFWNALGAVGTIQYVPADGAQSLFYLDRMFAWAEAHGLSVFLDLHGAPGSQNGADHSGCDDGHGQGDGIGWGLGTTVTTSLSAIQVLANRYGAHPAFLGIELLNEPGWAVEWNHGNLLEYYTQALKIVRAAAPLALVAFNVLYWDDFPAGVRAAHRILTHAARACL